METKAEKLIQKKIDWCIRTCDIDGCFDLEVARLQDAPEPYKSALIDNLNFQRFAAHNIADGELDRARKMAEKFTSKLILKVVIEEDEGSREQSNNVLHQEFYEVFVNKDWREVGTKLKETSDYTKIVLCDELLSFLDVKGRAEEFKAWLNNELTGE